MASELGYRQIPSLGNSQQRLAWSLGDLDEGRFYHWRVQAVDSAFAGSPWAPQGTFVVGTDLHDFGDAPYDGKGPLRDYPTLLAQNGAVHTMVPYFHLGALIDGEPDGQPNAGALGDDNNGGTETLDFSSATARIVVKLAKSAGEVQTVQGGGNTLALTGLFESRPGQGHCSRRARRRQDMGWWGHRRYRRGQRRRHRPRRRSERYCSRRSGQRRAPRRQ
jgi:hypothetical protein